MSIYNISYFIATKIIVDIYNGYIRKKKRNIGNKYLYNINDIG